MQGQVNPLASSENHCSKDLFRARRRRLPFEPFLSRLTNALRAAPEIAQCFGEKDFAVEALERCVALKEQHARVAQHPRGSLHFAFLPAEFEFMGRSIVLQFLAGREVVLPYGLLRRFGEAMPTAEGSQGLIGEHRPPSGQLFMDPHKIPLAARQQLQDLLSIGFGFLRTLQHRHLRGVGTKHLAYTQT